MVESVTAAPVSHAPPTHAASDSEMLTPIPTVTSTAAPLSPRLSYLDVATNAVPTPPTVTTPPAKGPDQTSSKPRVPSSPGVKGPAPSLDGKASAELAVAPVTGVSLEEPCSLAIRVDHVHTVRSLSAGLSFEDKCGIVGVAPLASGLCKATAAGAGGAIVSVTGTARRTIPPAEDKHAGRKKSTRSRRLAQQIVDSDQMFARALQAEEQAAADKIAATLAEDEHSAWSLTDSISPPVSCADSTPPRTGHVPPSPFDSPPRVARPALASRNRYDIRTSPGRQVDPVLVREAARTKATKEQATASFRLAYAAATRAERQHELAVAALSEGQGEERRLRHDMLNLVAGRKQADAAYQSAVAD